MKVDTIVKNIKQVKEGQSDFSSLLDALHQQTTGKKKVVSLSAVKRARQLNDCMEQLT